MRLILPSVGPDRTIHRNPERQRWFIQASILERSIGRLGAGAVCRRKAIGKQEKEETDA